MDSSTLGLKLQNQRIGALCYADDVVLLAESRVQLDLLIQKLEDFLSASKLSVNHSKCCSLSVKLRNGKRIVNDPSIPQVSIQGSPIPYLVDFYKYLGTMSNLQSFKSLPKPFDTFKENLAKLSHSPLFHFQKLEMLKIYLLPTLDYAMKNQCLRVEELKALDRAILANVRSWFKFPNSINNHLLYTPTSLGGLGLRNLRNDYASLRLSSALNLVQSQDERIQKIARSVLSEIVDRRTKSTMSPLEYLHRDKEVGPIRDVRSLLSSIRLNRKHLNVNLLLKDDDQTSIDLDIPTLQCPPNIPTFRAQQVSRIKRLRWHSQNKSFEAWRALLDQGRSVDCFSSLKESNSWLRTGQIAIQTYRFAVMGRVNVLPTKCVLKRRQLSPNTHCRRCPCDIESIGHVLNGCPHSTNLFRVRHDLVLDMLSKAIKPKKDWTLRINQTTPYVPSNRRPDLVLVNDKEKKIVIADITICYENNSDRLDQVRDHKVQKYSTEAGYLQDLGYEVHCTALVYGSLGSHHSLNKDIYSMIHTKPSQRTRKALLKKITVSVLESSNKIWRNHVRDS